MTIIWLLVGLGLIVLGADWLVEGASSIAVCGLLLLLFYKAGHKRDGEDITFPYYSPISRYCLIVDSTLICFA